MSSTWAKLLEFISSTVSSQELLLSNQRLDFKEQPWGNNFFSEEQPKGDNVFVIELSKEVPDPNCG